MEASGGYEQPAFHALWGLGLPCAIANARAVGDFARGMGAFEKTDRIDAEMIARYALTKQMIPASHQAALVPGRIFLFSPLP